MKKRIYYILVLVFNVVQLFSCKKFIEVDAPIIGLNAGNVYTTDATAAAVLTDIYAKMSSENISLNTQDITSLSLFASLGADDLALFNLNDRDLLSFYQNDLNRISQSSNYWNGIYSRIFAVNNALEGLTGSKNLTLAVQQQLLGEAYFMRAFSYFYLVNLYGDVPLVINLDYRTNALLSRTPVEQVYQQIITDLKKAQELLRSDYLKGDALTPYSSGSEERVRPTIWAATTLLARTYLYIGDWAAAEVEATKVISYDLYDLEPLNGAFLKNNREAIWQLQPVGNNAASNTGEGRLFILPGGGPGGDNNPVYLSNHLVAKFESGDQRKTNWIDSVVANGITYYYPFKYKIGNVIAPTTEYPTILRLAELYIIRAEARIRMGKIAEGIADLNVLRERATDKSAPLAEQLQQLPINLSSEVALQKVEQERRVELFTEWGHRWLDLKRTGRLDAVMSVVTPQKGGSWAPYKALYPIPQSDIDKNPNLEQNPGYN